MGSKIETLIVPSSVESFGTHAFAYCEHLREVVFLFGYRQGNRSNFSYCPNEFGETARDDVYCIRTNAFKGCRNLSLFTFNDGYRIERLGISIGTRSAEKQS